MSVKRGKYYWVRTEVGKEIAFKRDSGAWEMHGIDCTEDLRELILEVYEEVANEESKQTEKALVIQGVSNRRELLLKRQSDWLMRKTSLEVEKIVEFTERFKQ